jgi:SpoVK/Ycf46/Vps4 family AAA+-type ATPase
MRDIERRMDRVLGQAREASLLAIREFVTEGGDPDDADAVGEARVETRHLEDAREKVAERGVEADAGDANREIS